MREVDDILSGHSVQLERAVRDCVCWEVLQLLSGADAASSKGALRGSESMSGRGIPSPPGTVMSSAL